MWFIADLLQKVLYNDKHKNIKNNYMNVNLIVAIDSKCYGIGKNGSIPWVNKTDMKWFKKVTVGEGNNAVVMGRTTFESIGKPLPERINIVLSTTVSDIPGCFVAKNLDDAVNIAKENKVDSLFIIGGGKVYQEALAKNMVDILYIDKIDTINTKSDYDTFFDYDSIQYSQQWLSAPIIIDSFTGTGLQLKIYYNCKQTYCTTDEQYLMLMNDIIKNGQTKHTRAGETLSLFGKTMRFDVRDGLPILTTKKVYSKGCIHELLWFLKGETNIKYLVENNTHIWDDDAYRYFIQLFEKDLTPENRTTKEAFLENVLAQDTRTYLNDDNSSEQYTYGDLGPVYGKQWTSWNGINQIDELIDKLKNNPDDRRLIISAWNVGELKYMALPPCHYLSQWYVTEMSTQQRFTEWCKREGTDVNNNDDYPVDQEKLDEYLDERGVPRKYLSVMWQQRSVDTCLGLPYDLLSYSIFLHLVAQCVDMVPYEVICCLGDTHIYKNQLNGAIKQVKRNPYKYKPATLKLNPDIKNIYDFTYDNIKIENYNSYSPIKYELSVGL